MKQEIKDKLASLLLEETVEVKETNLSMARLIEKCYKPKESLSACRMCGNFGRLWCCPPFSDDYVERYKNYQIIILVAKIYFDRPGTTPEDKMRIYNLVCNTIHQTLLQKEKEKAGTALSFVGNCSFCPPGTCTRSQGEPCRHPENARRSLEGIGFDVDQILKKYFDMTLDWTKDDKLISNLTFVAALLYQ